MQLSPELILGIIGTLTGTLGLILQWRQWSVDRPVLKMDGKLTIRRSIELPDANLSLQITLRNHGRRQIHIVEVGFLAAENEWQHNNFLREERLKPGFLQPQEFILNEGGREAFEVYPLDLNYIKHARNKDPRTLIFYAKDSLDREYRLSLNLPREETIQKLEKSA